MSKPILIDDMDHFLTLVARSGLVAVDPLRELVAKFRQDEFTLGGTVAELGSFLTSRDILTHWQCQKLLEGKYKGFFLDQFGNIQRQHYYRCGLLHKYGSFDQSSLGQ